MPDRRSIFRLLALAGFLLTVALALWLAELRPLLVVIVMAAALLVAWTIEWLSWRQDMARLAVETAEEPLYPPVPPPFVPPVAAPQAPPEPRAVSPRAPSPPPAPPPEPPPPPPEPPPPPVVEEPVPLALPAPVAAPPPPPEPEPVPEPEPEPVPVPVAPPPEPERPVLRPVPPPPPAPVPVAPQPEPVRPAAMAGVVDMRTRVTAQPRRWNLWDLERRARDAAQNDPLRYEEWSYLFVHLRQFATPDGSLPTEFDDLVRESFGELLDHASG